MKRFVIMFVAVLVLAGCGTDAQVVRQESVPKNTVIGVIPFRDCLIADQDDCNGSGEIAATQFLKVFSGDGFQATLLSRSIGSKEPLSDAEAIEIAREKHLAFVINGEVTDFYSVAAMTFRADRAGITARILNVDDRQVAISYSDARASKTNFATPAGIIEDMAEDMRDELE